MPKRLKDTRRGAKGRDAQPILSPDIRPDDGLRLHIAQKLTREKQAIGKAVAEIQAPGRLRKHDYLSQMRALLSRYPDSEYMFARFAGAYHQVGEIDTARALLEDGIKNERFGFDISLELMTVLTDVGEACEAMKVAQRVMARGDWICPRQEYALFLVNCALYSLYCSGLPSTEVIDLHRKAGALLERMYPQQPLRPRRPERTGPLRVGLVSGDFREHAVARFLKPLFESFDEQRISLFCYDTSREQTDDDFRKLFIERSARFLKCQNAQTDHYISRYFKEIASDDLDILIDLSGYTGASLLPVFAMKPAPVQATWLGYPCTTGLSRIDYRMTDNVSDPVESGSQNYSEQLFRMRDTFLSFEAHERPIPNYSVPQAEHGYITFGCLNNFRKINSHLIEAWCRILLQVENSRLRLKSLRPGDSYRANMIRRILQDQGIAPDRLEVIERAPSYADLLRCYDSIDLALDTFPYNGTTTTCEALWMGVPVVTLTGNMHVSRVSTSILTSIGCRHLCTNSVDDYVEQAVSVARDKAYLEDFRRNSRKKMALSTIGNPDRFARDFEDAIELMCSLGRENRVNGEAK